MSRSARTNLLAYLMVFKYMKVGMEEEKIHALLKKITLAADEGELSNIYSLLSPENIGKPVMAAFVNAHALNLCCKDVHFLRQLLESDYVFRDGSGMKLLFRMLGVDPGLNLNGTDFIPQIVKVYAGRSCALFGTKEPHLDRAAEVMQEKGVTPVCIMDGFREDNAYLQAARSQPASLIVLGMGMPKQERVARLLASNLDHPCLIICGGAILDFMSGRVTRAPLIFRRLGIEWLYRLAQEPGRLFRRYVIGNFVFFIRSFSLILSSKRIDEKKCAERKTGG